MNRTKIRYLDWIVTATCRKHSPHDASGPGRYTGYGIAVLADLDNDHCWSDPRPQTSDIVSQVYSSSDACLAAIVAQLTQQIKTMDRRGSHSRVAPAQAAPAWLTPR